MKPNHLEIVSQGKGNTSLISAYNSSSVGLTERWTLNAGIYGQLLTLNNKWSVEPRVGLKWQATPKATFALVLWNVQSHGKDGCIFC